MRYWYWRLAVAAAQRCALYPPLQKTVEHSGALALSACECPTRLHVASPFHDLRHSHVAYLIAVGWNFYMIHLRPGHVSVKSTFENFGHLLPQVNVTGFKPSTSGFLLP